MSVTASWRNLKTVATVEHSIYSDGAAWSRAQELRATIRDAVLKVDGLVSNVPALQAELAPIVAQLEDSEIRFVFTEIPRKVYEALVSLAPSSDPDYRFEESEFVPLLVAAATTVVSGPGFDQKSEPIQAFQSPQELLAFLEDDSKRAITVSDAAELLDELNEKQFRDFYAAVVMPQAVAPAPFTLAAFEQTLSSDDDSTGVSEPESLRPGS